MSDDGLERLGDLVLRVQAADVQRADDWSQLLGVGEAGSLQVCDHYDGGTQQHTRRGAADTCTTQWTTNSHNGQERVNPWEI